jgi:hypothetical protein
MHPQVQPKSFGRPFPNFNDAHHDRPILADSGGVRAALILLGILLGIAGLALILTIV